MSVAFVSAANNTASTTGTTESVTVTKPTSVSSGDLLVAVVYVTQQSSGPAVSSWAGPSGWTLSSSQDTQTSASGAMAVFYKIAGGSEPSSYTFTVNFGSSVFIGMAACILHYSGTDTSGPQNVTFSHTSGAASSLAAPSITGTAGQTLICGWGFALGGTTSAPSGMTLEASAVHGGSETCQVFDETLSASGSTGTRTASFSSDQSTAVSFSISPGGASASVTGVAAASTATGVAGTVTAERDASATGVAAAETVTGVAGSLSGSTGASVTGIAAAATATGVAGTAGVTTNATVTGVAAAATATGVAGTSAVRQPRWGADANVLGWQRGDIGGVGTAGATLAAVRSYLIATYLPDGLGPNGKFFDGGSGWHATYTNFAGSGYGGKANERHPVICAKTHTTSSFNTLMTDMAEALPAGEIWYACYYSEPEAGFNAGTLTHAGYQSTWAAMNTLRAAHPNGSQVKFIPILMAYQEISGTQHWADFLLPVLAYADVIGWDVYDDNADPQIWSFEDDIYPAILDLQAASGLPWSIPEYGLQVSTHSGSTDNAAGVLGRWESMVAICDTDPNFLWGNYWMDGPHAPNQRTAVIRTDTTCATYLTSLVADDFGGVTTPPITLEIPPTLRADPTYTYFLADLLTNEIIEEIAFTDVSFTQVLNGAGDFKGSVVLSDASNKKSRIIAATIPGRTALYVDRGGILVWGGVVWGRRYTSTDNKLEIDATEFWSYFRRRRIVTAAYSDVDQFTIATGLIDDAQSLPGGDIGVLLPDPGSGGVNRDCVYYSYQRKPVSEAIEDMADLEDGFDFRIAVKWDSGVPTKTFIPRIRHWTYDVEFDTAAPLNSPRMFELPGNLRDYEWDDDASTLATSFTVAGSGSGPDLTTHTKTAATKLSLGWPLLEGELIFPDLTDDAAVLARAQAEMDIHKIGRTMPQFNVRCDMDPLLGTYHVGQTCRVRITDPRFPHTKDVVFPAITAIEVTPPDGENDEYAAISVAIENPTGGDGA